MKYERFLLEDESVTHHQGFRITNESTEAGAMI
jgi:hypothetical protein